MEKYQDKYDENNEESFIYTHNLDIIDKELTEAHDVIYESTK